MVQTIPRYCAQFVISSGAQRSGEICGLCVTADPCHSAIVSLRCGKPQISPLRFALSKIIPGSLLCQQLWSLTLATQGWGTLDLLEGWVQNRHQSRVPHIWRALCARCGKPQISPLRFAPVEMTKLGVIANPAFPQPIFIPLGEPQAHEYSGPGSNVYSLASQIVCTTLVYVAF